MIIVALLNNIMNNNPAPLKDKLTFFIMLMVTSTLCVVILAMVTALMFGLYNEKVDNTEIFKLISPAFQTIIGGFIGILAGIKVGRSG
jgi:undecaprenyl pyrophosphate phosphatase UppP